MCGSALSALEEVNPEVGEKAIHKLIAVLDSLPMPVRNFEADLIMPINKAHDVTVRSSPTHAFLRLWQL